VNSLPQPFKTVKPRVHRKRRLVMTPAPAALMLVAASFDTVGVTALLTFDRAVDASGFVADQVTVIDGVTNASKYGGVGAATVISPTTIRVALDWIDDGPLGAVTLTATGLTGIVAVDDGGTWAGVTDLVLPFP
jgi:hypothetical protein